MGKIFNKDNLFKLLGALGILAAIFGYKFYNKSVAHDDVEQQLYSLCGEEQDCIAVVKEHFESCFSSSYDLGGRRRSGGIRTEKLVACINQKSGTAFFSAGEEEE